ncbi:MAG TPA: hypothetical protein VMW47_11505 [Verrucomicrobiae bacterium]|nr:hypothetical protein [Verrucomicrobiae bacterium]
MPDEEQPIVPPLWPQPAQPAVPLFAPFPQSSGAAPEPMAPEDPPPPPPPALPPLPAVPSPDPVAPPSPVVGVPPAIPLDSRTGGAGWGVRTRAGTLAPAAAPAPPPSPAAVPGVPPAGPFTPAPAAAAARLAPAVAPPPRLRPHGGAPVAPGALPSRPVLPPAVPATRGPTLRVAVPSLLALAAVAALLWEVERVWVNVTVGRDFSFVPVLRLQDAGRLTLAALWHPVAGSRLLAPELVVFGLVPVVHLDTRAEMLFSVILLACVAGALVALWGETGPWRWWWVLPAVLVTLSWVQLPTLLLGFRFSDALAVAGVVAALAMLNRDQLELGAFVFAVLAAGIATCSSFEGLFVWPAGLVVLAGRPGSWLARTSWLLCGAGAIVAALWHVDVGGLGGPGLATFWQDPGRAIGFLLVSVGSVLPAPGGGGIGVAAAEILGGAILLAAALVIVLWGLRRPADRRLAGMAAVIAFSVLVDIAEAAGHVQLGIASASISRYGLVNLLLLAAVYLGGVTLLRPATSPPPRATAGPAPPPSARLGRGARGIATLAAAAVLLAVAGLAIPSGLRTGPQVQRQRLRSAQVLAGYAAASPRQIVETLYPRVSTLRADAAFLVAHRLGIFWDSPP